MHIICTGDIEEFIKNYNATYVPCKIVIFKITPSNILPILIYIDTVHCINDIYKSIPRYNTVKISYT